MVYLRDYPALRIENQVLWFLEKVRNIWNVVSESAYQLNVAFSYKGFENIRGKTLFGRILLFRSARANMLSRFVVTSPVLKHAKELFDENAILFSD